MADQRSEKHEEARGSVPKDLRDGFDELVELGWRYVEHGSRSDE